MANEDLQQLQEKAIRVVEHVISEHPEGVAKTDLQNLEGMAGEVLALLEVPDLRRDDLTKLCIAAHDAATASALLTVTGEAQLLSKVIRRYEGTKVLPLALLLLGASVLFAAKAVEGSVAPEMLVRTLSALYHVDAHLLLAAAYEALKRANVG